MWFRLRRTGDGSSCTYPQYQAAKDSVAQTRARDLPVAGNHASSRPAPSGVRADLALTPRSPDCFASRPIGRHTACETSRPVSSRGKVVGRPTAATPSRLCTSATDWFLGRVAWTSTGPVSLRRSSGSYGHPSMKRRRLRRAVIRSSLKYSVGWLLGGFQRPPLVAANVGSSGSAQPESAMRSQVWLSLCVFFFPGPTRRPPLLPPTVPPHPSPSCFE